MKKRYWVPVGLRSLLVAAALFLCGAPAAGAQLVSDERLVSYPAFGLYNGFNSHTNILECSNYSGGDLPVTLTLFHADGSGLGSTGFTVSGNGSFHLILNDRFAIQNEYGLFRLESSAGASTALRCNNQLYRFSGARAGVPIAYSFALPVLSSISGDTAGLFNSLNPVSEALPPVQNYLTLANPGDASFSATVELYADSGQLLGSVPVSNLLARQRIDLPVGHPNGKGIGLYRIVPANGSAPYLASLSVYAPGAADFAYGYQLNTSRGSCGGEPLFVSTMGPAYSWLQVGNPSPRAVAYTVEVRNSLGSLVHSEDRQLSPFAHEHLFANAFLGDNNLGTVEVRCGGGGLLVQGATYGRTGAGGAVSWGYANQIRDLNAGAGELVVQPFNSFLGVLSWLRTTNVYDGSSELVAQVRTGPADARSLLALTSYGASTDLGLFSLAPADRVGSIAAAPTTAGEAISSELLRVYPGPGGVLGYISLIPPAVVSGQLASTSLDRIASGLSQPVALANAGDGSGRLFVVELDGRIRIISGGNLLPTPFLDISQKVLANGEQGFLGLAFHPNFESNGKFYVDYIDLGNHSIIEEYRVSSNLNVADPSTARTLLSVTQPYSNHKGGQLNFGPDGYLYIALGDGGSGGDPQNHAQDRSDLLGDLLRIDVNSGAPYGVPGDNPFVGVNGARPEIFAYGFRNPWRFSFDRLNGRLFVADVGQGAEEEIDIVNKGGNYGWRIMEGDLCYNPPSNCPTNGLSLPIHAYSHDDGIAVIGGYVYRGNVTSSMYGKYIFGDFGSQKIWTLTEQSGGSWTRNDLLSAGFPISSFGEDEAGEIYVANLNGEIYHLSFAP